MYKAIFNTICDFQEISEISIFLTKLGTFGKMAPNFVTLGSYKPENLYVGFCCIRDSKYAMALIYLNYFKNYKLQ